MADDDAARSLREHAARDHCGGVRGAGRRQCHRRAAASRWLSGCPMRRRGAWRAISSSCCWKNPISARVSDPAAGSGGIEDLTAQLCNAAWTLFQEIEKTGGIWPALESNMALAENRGGSHSARRQHRPPQGCADRHQRISDIHEAPVHVLHVQPVAVPAMPPAPVTFDALAPMRLAEPFEALRDASDKWLASRPARPRVFLANLGTLADFTAARDLCQELVRGRRHRGRRICALGQRRPHRRFQGIGRDVCLPVFDRRSSTRRVPKLTAKALAAAGATHIYLAGRRRS